MVPGLWQHVPRQGYEEGEGQQHPREAGAIILTVAPCQAQPRVGPSHHLTHSLFITAPRGRDRCFCHLNDEESGSEVRGLPRSPEWESSDPEATC